MSLDIRVRQSEGLRRRRDLAERPSHFYPGARRAARATLALEDVRAGELSITFLDDAEIAALNAQYLQHDRPTDVIAFALFEPGEAVVGDVYLGFEQAVRQARQHGAPLAEEIVRLTVHGALHVLGHDHPSGAARLRSAMWRLQEEIVTGVLRGAKPGPQRR